MRIPELPLEPVVRADVGIGPYGERADVDVGPCEDEDRIHELVKRANEYIERRIEKPEWVGPWAELMPGEYTEIDDVANNVRRYGGGDADG